MYIIYFTINDQNRNNVYHYIDNKFGIKIGGGPAIFTIRTYLFSFLMYWFDGLNSTYKSTDMVTKIMLIISRKSEINLQMLKEWGKSVRK